MICLLHDQIWVVRDYGSHRLCMLTVHVEATDFLFFFSFSFFVLRKLAERAEHYAERGLVLCVNT